MDSADSRYGQLNKPIGRAPYKEASLKGFTPPQPFQVASHFLTKGDFCDFHFPTLVELNDKLFPFPWIDDEERRRAFSGDDVEEPPALYTGPPPSHDAPSLPSAPPLSTLVASIINSSDRLFFISHSLGNPSTSILVAVSFDWRHRHTYLFNTEAFDSPFRHLRGARCTIALCPSAAGSTCSITMCCYMDPSNLPQ